MTRSGRAVLVVEVDVLADIVEDDLNDLVDAGAWWPPASAPSATSGT